MNLAVALIAYAAAMVGANLSVAAFGPSVSPLNAFLLIGLDLALRDWLHVRLRPWQMAALIACTAGITFLLNPAAAQIAVAASVAFTLAAMADWIAFAKLRGTWLFRANGSNVAGALVDSFVFPLIAFGAFLPHIVALQFVAKVAGGGMWAFVINRVAPMPAR